MTTPNSINNQIPQEPEPKAEPLNKEELERKKLLLEIKDLERPFWKRPAYVLAALPTLLAITALTVGFINGFFSAQLTKLDNQKHDLEAQIKEFEGTRNALVSQNKKLQQDVLVKEGRLGNIKGLANRLRWTALSMRVFGESPSSLFKNDMPEAEDSYVKRRKELVSELENIISELDKEIADDRK